jgi:ABC-type glycerol-3-phosphate transport system substrate-binding protein
VKLVNYPIGLKPLGVPDGLQGVAKMHIAKHVKPIIEDFVQFWQQEAEAKKAELEGDYHLPLYADDEDEDEVKKKRQVFEEDLVRFVAWDEGMYTLFLA